MKHFIPAFVVFISLFSIAHNAFALPTLRSFGGRVITTTAPGVTCAAQYGIISIRPAGIFPPTGYIVTATSKTVSAGGWILGLYNPTPTEGICYTDTVPPITLPAFNIIKFGASKSFSF